jgi:hypothetical protein
MSSYCVNHFTVIARSAIDDKSGTQYGTSGLHHFAIGSSIQHNILTETSGCFQKCDRNSDY